MDLYTASRTGDSTTVQLLLDAGADPNTANEYGVDPLRYAVVYGNEEIVQLLLDAGANPNITNPDDRTHLHSAALGGQEAITRLLLAAGADPNVADWDGWTTLHMAAYHGYEEIVQLLLAAGADPTLRINNGKTPSQVARTPELHALLVDAEHVWTHSWNPEEHHRWAKAQRLERVGALSAFRTRTGRRIVIPELPRELQFAVFEHL